MRKVPADCIFIACHKPCYIPDVSCFYPVRVGAELHKEPIEGMQDDNEGENISSLNPDYCELTAQYWAWKNTDCEYYGFFHYRRFLAFDKVCELDDRGSLNEKLTPYIELDHSWDDLSAYKIDTEHIQTVIHKYDILTVCREHINTSVYEQFARYHRAFFLDEAIRIIRKLYPEYTDAADSYMSSRYIYYMNMYIMRQDVFRTYMDWLFGILSELDRSLGGEQREPRLMGFIAERLFGIFYTYKISHGAKCAELRYIKFYNTDPDAPQSETEFREFELGGFKLKVDMRKLNRLFPAGSRRRRWLRGMVLK